MLTNLRQLEVRQLVPECACTEHPQELTSQAACACLQMDSAVESTDVMEGLLAAMPGLTTLALHLFGAVLHLPRGVTALRHLRRLSFSTYADGPVETSLPAGPWLAQLRWLGLPWQMAVPAAASLATATQLQHLCLFALPPYDLCSDQGVAPEQWAAFWRAMQAHPCVRSLFYKVAQGKAVVPSAFVDGLLQLGRRRPEMRIVRTEDDCADDSEAPPGSSPFWKEMLGAAAEPTA